jgi:hypothetical protein
VRVSNGAVTHRRRVIADVRTLDVMEVEPNRELAQLLREFDDRGGVLEYAFYQSDESLDLNVLHRNAAHRFLDDCATAYHARAAEIDYDEYPLARLYTYKWEPDALRGTRITFDAFWGTDNITPEQIDAHACSIPDVDGYKTAFFHPPHGLPDGVDGNQSLFTAINRHIFGSDRNSLVVWSWSTDCSGYFDAGREWWGAYLWTLSPPDAQTVTLIGASSTD